MQYSEKKLKQIADIVLKSSRADQTEVTLFASHRNLTRFANSQIHQNVAWDDISVTVRAIVGKKIGVATTNKFDTQSLKAIAEKAYEIAKVQREDPYFVSLPSPKPITAVPSSFVQKTADASPEAKARTVKTIIDKAVAAKVSASGAFDTVISEMAIANSLGVWAYTIGTTNSISTVLTGSDKTGYAAQFDPDIDKISPDIIVDKAIAKATFPKAPIELAPGEYEVILEPEALADEFLGYYAWLGPNARVYHEDASHISGNLGKKIYSEKLTIVDDPFNPQGMPQGFDFEGYPKQILPIIEKGVAKNIVYDSYNATRYQHGNTGHALPAPNTMGPIPLHLQFTAGDQSVDAMIKNVKRGIYVTRFWYIRMLHHKILNITGMTRDGTFLIENGELTAPVKNMRFTQSIPKAFADIIDVGDTLTLHGGWFGANLIPALHIANFNFTGKTLF